MASFKLTINDPKGGKAYQKEVKDSEADIFLGLNIGEKVNGEAFGLEGYEFEITGGSDKSGFPMRKGIKGARAKISSMGGIGFRHMKKGQMKRKTVCGHKISDSIVQININSVKEGPKKLAEIFGKAPLPEAKQ